MAAKSTGGGHVILCSGGRLIHSLSFCLSWSSLILRPLKWLACLWLYCGNLGAFLQSKTKEKYVVQIDVRPIFLPSLNHSFSHSAQIILHLKNEVLPLSKVSLFNSNEDQQKNSSSFVNTSWCPVKSGHYFYNARNIPLWSMFNYWSLLPCNNFMIITLIKSFWL